MTNEERLVVLARYADGEITAEAAADLLGPGVAVADVVLETGERYGRLPNAKSAFTDGEFRRGLVLLGLEPRRESTGRSP